MALPRELISQWAGEGMGSKAIASKLNSELGIKVSYKTVQRVLSGEREFDKQSGNKITGSMADKGLTENQRNSNENKARPFI